MTKLYFHEALSTLSGTLPTTTQSGLTITESVDAATVNRTMDDNRGAGPQTSKAAVINQSTARTTYFTCFCSQPLKAGTISANTWNYSFAAQQSATAMQFPTVTGTTNPVRICAYVWRPGTGAKVGDILNANSNSDFGSTAATTLKCTFGTFAGSAVTVQAGDIICFEVIFLYTPTTGSKTGTYYYDGNTENTGDGIVVSNHATYIETPQTLTFSVVQRAVTETVSASSSNAIRVTPGAGNNANIKTKKMTLTLDATSGVHDQAFTGAGFQPKAMIVYGVLTTGSAYAEGYSAFYGFSDGASHNACVAVADVDNVSTYDCSNMVRNDACIDLLSTAAGNAELIRGVVKTFDSDGVTITWNVKNTTQYIIHVLFIGGTDITNVFVGQTTVGTTSTGTKGYTGVGFKPDIEFYATGGNVTVNTLTAGAPFGIGVSVSSAKQFTNIMKMMDNVASNAAQNSGIYFASAQCLAATKLTASSTWDLRASFTSHDSDGFTLTHNTAPVASTFPFIFMCIKGGLWDAGAFTQKTSSGIQTTTPIVFADPEGLLLTISDDTTKDQINITNTSGFNTTISIGACDNTAEGYIGFGDAFQSTPGKPVMISSTTKLIRNITPAATATSSTTDSECDISDMATIGDFDINWTTADATARWIGYVLLQKGPIATGQNITKSMPTETVSISEALARRANKIRALATQTVAISEALTRLVAKIRVLATQTITSSETIVKMRNKPRAPAAETITVGAGTLTRLAAKVRVNTESVTITAGTLARLLAKIRVNTETVNKGETLARILTKSRAIPAESVTITAGTLARLAGKIRTLTETVNKGETIARLLSKYRTLIENTSATGSIARARGIQKVISGQSVSILDSLSRLKASLRTASDTLTSVGTVSKSLTKMRLLNESVSISDIINRTTAQAQHIIKALTETVTISAGTLVRLLAKQRALPAETVSKSETLTRLAGKVRVNTETVNKGETLAKRLTKNRAITETVSVIENLARLAAKKRALATETVIVGTGTLTKLLSKVRVLTETVSKGETLTRLLAKNRIIAAEITNVVENLTRLAAKKKALATETVSITDSAIVATSVIKHIVRVIDEIDIVVSDFFYKARTLIENVFTSDLASQIKTDNTPTNYTKTLSDTSSIGAGILTRQSSKLKPVTESAIVIDNLAITRMNKNRVNIESIPITDNVTQFKPIKNITASLSDSVSIGESSTRRTGKARRIGGPG